MDNQVSIQNQAKSLQALLEVSKKQIEAALPKHLTPDRLLRIAMTEARKNPALLKCTQTSFIGAIIQTAQLGLEPGGALGHSYLVPFKNKNTGNTDVQLIVGYRGMIDLGYRSPKVKKIVARPVYDTDKFSYQFGLDEKLEHTPDPLAEGNHITHTYVIVELITGAKLFDVMTKRDIEAARGRSKSPEKGPWDTDYEAMAVKSVVRRFFKFCPVSIELQQVIGMDEAGDRGEQDNGSFFETTGTPVAQSKTDQLKAALSSSHEFETPPADAEEQGAFNAFQGGRVAAPKVEMAEEPAPFMKTREEYVTLIVQAGVRLGLNIKAVTARAKKEYKKEPSDMSVAELDAFLNGLQNEGQSVK